jgi:cyclophilin family peptidyl-prolyl cis-trans isomerase
MNKKLFTLFSVLTFAVFTACNQKPASKNSSAAPVVKKGIAPVADSEVAVIETDFGTITIELYSNIAPKMVTRFKELAKEGYYNGIAFHRINQSVIQAGNADTKGDGNPIPNKPEGDSGKPDVEAEFSDIPYDTGIVGAARSTDFNSANSQFFITLKRETGFDNKYTIFGKVIDGMNNARTIAGAPVVPQTERPQEPILIKTVKIQPKP